MSIPTLRQPPPRFVADSAVALAAVLFASILTIWVTERGSVSLLKAGVLGLAAVWSGLMVIRPYRVQGSFALLSLAGAVSIGLVQLLAGHTVNRWETWNAVLCGRYTSRRSSWVCKSVLRPGWRSASGARYSILRSG